MTDAVRTAIEEAAKRGWQIHLTFEWDDPPEEGEEGYGEEPAHEWGGISGSVRASRGQAMCPHKVPYRPEDGHGYESWPADGYDSDQSFFMSWEQLVERLNAMPPLQERELIVRG